MIQTLSISWTNLSLSPTMSSFSLDLLAVGTLLLGPVPLGEKDWLL